MTKNFKLFVLMMLGFAIAAVFSLCFATGGHVNAHTTTTTTTKGLAYYTHITAVATIDRRQVMRGPQGARLVTYSTDADGAEWIHSINLTCEVR